MYEWKFVHNKRVAAGLGVLRQLPIAINNLCCSSKLKGTVEVIDKIQDFLLWQWLIIVLAQTVVLNDAFLIMLSTIMI